MNSGGSFGSYIPSHRNFRINVFGNKDYPKINAIPRNDFLIQFWETIG